MGAKVGRWTGRFVCATTALVLLSQGAASAASVHDPDDSDRFDIRKVAFVRVKPDGPAVLTVRFYEGFRGPALDGRLGSAGTHPDLVLLTFRSAWGYMAGAAYIRWVDQRGQMVACFYHPDDPDFVYPRLSVGHPRRDLLRLKIPSGLLPYGKNRVRVESYLLDRAPWVSSVPGA